MDLIDQGLRHRLRNWAASQPLPRNGRERLIKAVVTTVHPYDKLVEHHPLLHHSARFNWTATYVAGDRLLNLRLVC
jgi:hypothetical protein